MNILELAILKQMVGGGGGSGTDNYNDLSNLPQINGETLAGNKSSSNLGLQDEIDSDNKLASDLVDDENQENKFVTSSEKNTWNAKQNAIDSDHKLDADLVDDSESTNKFVTSTEKNTWNAKQNAIDSDHKLSSSLVSFSESEAAALASGIDSSKVEQISTNQTNILYAINTSVKNTFNLLEWCDPGIYSTVNGLNARVMEDGRIHIYGTMTAQNNTDLSVRGSYASTTVVYTTPTSDSYTLSATTEGNVRNSELHFYSKNTGPYDDGINLTSGTDSKTLHAQNYTWLMVRVPATTSAVDFYVTPMVSLTSIGNTDFEPYALPNTDLTRMMTPFFTVPINHNMIYRGQNLGETLTEAQDTALSSGNFTDLYLGDYWTKSVTIPAFYEVTTAEPSDWSTNYTSYYTKSGDTYTPVSGDTAPTWAANTYYERLVPAQTVTLKAVIADFDTFYSGYASGYAAINSHHAAVVVHGFNNVVWNKTNTTAGGYVNSLIHKWLVGSVLPQIETWFGSAKVLSHRKLLTNAITGDAASGWAWSSQKISLLSENQMYGSKVWGNSKATNGGYEPGEAFKQLNVFNHIDANLLFGNRNIWLRDISSAVWAADLDNIGYANCNAASNAWFAPAALILLS